MEELLAWARDVVASLDAEGHPTGLGRRPSPAAGDPASGEAGSGHARPGRDRRRWSHGCRAHRHTSAK